jgi:hypothetical protein
MEFVSIESVGMIMRQTNYTKEQAEKKLSEHNNVTINVIKEYLNISETKTKQLSNNQQNIKNIRDMLKNTKPITPTLQNKK